MKIEITSVSTSKKGTTWLQCKVVEGYPPIKGDVLNCEHEVKNEQEKKEEPKKEGGE